MNSKSWSFPGAVLLALVGCAPSNPGIEIEGLLASGEGCVFMPGASSTLLVSPVLDTGTTNATRNPGGIHYSAAFQVVNRMLNRANTVYPLSTDTNSFHIEEAEVELRGLDGTPLPVGDLPSRFRVPASGFIPSSTGTEPGRGLAVVDVVPAIYGDALAGSNGTIVIAVSLTGVTSGDSRQTTAELEFPLQLCNECLFRCAEDEEGLPIATDILSCTPGQDALSLIGCPVP